jgi:hypothetical protein
MVNAVLQDLARQMRGAEFAQGSPS